MPTIRFYNQGTFPSALKWQAISFMRVQWPFVFQGPGRLISEPYPPELSPIHFVAVEGEVLLSYASLLHLILPFAGDSYAVLGFGNMFTFPPYRREGLGLRVLELASHYIQQSHADVAMLFCDEALIPFYRRSGWEPIAAPTYLGAIDAFHQHQAVRMQQYVSNKGKAARERFMLEPLYVEEAW